MKISILLITHHGIGSALLNIVSETLGSLPLTISLLDVDQHQDPEYLVAKAVSLTKTLDTGNGVLVLTDMYGSTPSNIAHQLQQFGLAVRVIAGLNLPMMLKVLNYPLLSLNELAQKAISGGREGIIEPSTEEPLSPREHNDDILPTKIIDL